MTNMSVPTTSTTVTVDRVLELARQLDLPERARLLAQLAADVESTLARQPLLPTTTAEERRNRIHALQQQYGHLLSSSDAFARRKQEEIDLEERRP